MTHSGDNAGDDPNAPLRILMVLDAPWDRRLGGPRIYIELAEQFSRAGHHVDVFAWNDAFPKPAAMPRVASFTRRFASRAAAWIRQYGADYDIIDAGAGSVFAPKARLGFTGLMVTRSTGLLPVYEREFIAADRSAPGGGAHPLTRVPRRIQRAFTERRHHLSFERCDLLNVLNSDEETYACDELGMEHKTVKLPSGLTRERFEAFTDNHRTTEERLQRPVIAFIGSWCRRKGSTDAAQIVRAVRDRAPTATFRFLGTGAAASEVISDCGGDEAGIEVIPSFESEQLPRLLDGVGVGILPSYVEGFPFSVIELLAAGAPVVAYDAPGSREILRRLDSSLLVKKGDSSALGARTIDLLKGPNELKKLSNRAVALAGSLRWEDIAAETLRIYEDRLSQLRRTLRMNRPRHSG